MYVNTAFNRMVKANIMKDAKQKCCVRDMYGQTSGLGYSTDIWLDSLKPVAYVLLKENQQLLKVTADLDQLSVTKLFALERSVIRNFSKALKKLNNLGAICLASVSEKVKGHRWSVRH